MANKCIDCGKDISTTATRCRSCANKAMWNEPGRKERQRELMSKTLRENNRKLWEDPKYREHQSEWRRKANEVRWAKKGAHEEHSRFIQAMWADKDFVSWVRENVYDNPEWRFAKRDAQFPELAGQEFCNEYPPEFDDELRERIRKRDGRRCIICGRTEKEEGQRMAVHHCDWQKDNNDPANLVSLCRVCHGRVHGGNVEEQKAVEQYSIAA